MIDRKRTGSETTADILPQYERRSDNIKRLMTVTVSFNVSAAIYSFSYWDMSGFSAVCVCVYVRAVPPYVHLGV